MALYINALTWTTYGVLVNEMVVAVQNGISVVLACLGLAFLLALTGKDEQRVELRPVWLKAQIWNVVIGWTVVIVLLIIGNQMLYISAGFVGMLGVVLAVAQFASPLLMLKQVLSQGFVGGLLDPKLSLLMLLMGLTWTVYGHLISDAVILAPNLLGSVLSGLQLYVLFTVPPTKDGWPECRCCHSDDACVKIEPVNDDASSSV